MRRSLVSLALLAIILLAACGGDDSTDAPVADGDGGTAVEVVAEDIAFATDAYEAEAGTVGVEYRNDGNITHTLLIDEVEDFKLEVDGNGDVDEGTVDLEPGTYTLFCDVPGHREAGMEATLEVR